MRTDEEWLQRIVTVFLSSSRNRLGGCFEERAWDDPLLGFSSGVDPLYQFFKTDIGDFHLTPTELFQASFPDEGVRPDDLTVVTWVLPQTEATKGDQRLETYFPSERWARSRTRGETINDELRKHVVDSLLRAGVKAVAPVLSNLFSTLRESRYGYASTWSERHAAYVAGLGTFGLCDGLITPRGKAVRIGSVVAATSVPPSVRPYEDHHAYCLFYAKGVCGECIQRCPIGAISTDGHDKNLCRRYGRMCSNYIRRHYGFDGTGCGFCQTGVPCESGIPDGIRG